MACLQSQQYRASTAILQAAHSADAPVIVEVALEAIEVGNKRDDDTVQSDFWKARRTIIAGPALGRCIWSCFAIVSNS
jgi:hypothetical protein